MNWLLGIGAAAVALFIAMRSKAASGDASAPTPVAMGIPQKGSVWTLNFHLSREMSAAELIGLRQYYATQAAYAGVEVVDFRGERDQLSITQRYVNEQTSPIAIGETFEIYPGVQAQLVSVTQAPIR